MADSEPLSLEVLNSSWERLALSNGVVRATVTKELGTIGDASVTIPIDDAVITYIPDSNSPQANEARWRLYEGNTIKFAGVVDQTTRSMNEDNTYTFGGKHRGIALGDVNAGRRDFNGWPVDELFEELLRDNIGKAPFATIQAFTTESSLHPAINAITGDPFENQYWSSAASGSNHSITVDLGDQSAVSAIRIMPPWWKIGGQWGWYQWTVETSTDNATWTTRGTKSDTLPSNDRGELYEFSATIRYVKVTITDSYDDIGRLAGILIYRDVATVGSDTTYALSWIENDDSGNVALSGSAARVTENGAFNGDGILGNSLVTRLSGTSGMTHTFRGTSTSVYFTQGTTGGNASADIYIDGDLKDTVTLSGNTYQVKGYEITGLTSGTDHTMFVDQNTGMPQVDYFTGEYESAWRILRDNDSSIGYYGNWTTVENANYANFTAQRSATSGSMMLFDFTGDEVKIIGTKGPTMGKMDVFLDGVLSQADVDLYNSSYQYQQTLYHAASGVTFGDHSVRVDVKGTKNVSSSGSNVDIDGIEGNFSHIIYLRSFYEPNLRLLTRMSEIANAWLRFNDDGTVDLLGSVGDSSGTIIREGENEGGTIINAQVEDDYSETASAVLALVTGPDDLPIKAFVVDRSAVERMGLKVRKMEEADANDAYLLTRQAWNELREHIEPQSRYEVQFDPDEVGNITEGQTTILYSPRLKLQGDKTYRVGRIVTEYSQ